MRVPSTPPTPFAAVLLILAPAANGTETASDGCGCGRGREYVVSGESGTAAETTTATTASSGTSEVCGDPCPAGGDPACPERCPAPAACGDRVVAGAEQCDDGDAIAGDGCEPDCRITPGWPCGDGTCAPPEDPANCAEDCPPACPDGACSPGEDANLCPQDCASLCGQGTCEPGESPADCAKDCPPDKCRNHLCEVGEDPDDCPEDCPPGECGNHRCEPGRGEDDPMSADYCAQDCPPVCGDGKVAPAEACDDGNAVDDDACSNDCTPARRVFITGDATPGALGGVAGADKLCSDAAAGKLPGTFQAWISDGNASNAPGKRLASVDFTGWYLLPGEATAVAHGWAGLTGADLAAAITRDADGNPIAGDPVAWTNTLRSGERSDPIDHCMNWTMDTYAVLGRQGLSDPAVVDAQWSNGEDAAHCSTAARLYCFQTAP